VNSIAIASKKESLIHYVLMVDNNVKMNNKL